MVFFRAPTLRRKPKDCQRKPSNLLLIVLNPEFAKCSSFKVWKKTVMPWSSIPQCPTVSGGQGRDPVLPFRFSPLMFQIPRYSTTCWMPMMCFFLIGKNIWISQELHIHHCGFDWIWLGNLHLGSFFWKFHAWFEQNPERGKLWHWLNMAESGRCSCSRPTKNCISKTSPGWRFWNLGKLRSGIGLEVHQRIASETRGLKSGHATKKSDNQFKAHQWIIEVLVMYDISLYDLLQSVVYVFCPTRWSVHIEWKCCACTDCIRYASCSKNTPILPWPWFM